MSLAESQPAVPRPSVRWFHLTPDRLVVGLLVVEVLLWLSERFGWLPWHKGYAVLAAVAVVGVAMLLVLVWFAIALVFRRRIKFSLPSLLVIVIVVALPCIWMAVEMRAAKRQEEAVTAIHWLEVIYDHEVNKSGQIVGGRPKEPIWLRNLLGDDFFTDVVGVFSFYEVSPSFRSRRIPIADEGLNHIVGLSHLHWMYLTHSEITDEGLAYLIQWHELDDLKLAKTEISDAGLHHLEGLTHLRFLNLTDTKVTNAGVAKLQQALPKCRIVTDMSTAGH